MKRLLLILLCVPFFVYSQELKKINNYKYIVIDRIEGDELTWHFKNLKEGTYNNLSRSGYNIFYSAEVAKKDVDYPKDLLENPELALYLRIEVFADMGSHETVALFLFDNNSNLIWNSSKTAQSVKQALRLSLLPLSIFKYQYNPTGINNRTIESSSVEWRGNGSGFFISKSGYIVTNNHVIDGASEIEVEFRYKNEIEGFNAKVIKVDKTNDLAILKIDDSEFSVLSTIPYNFKTRSVDVGTEIFALGYPLALTLMGKDIKFTDGKISSKTGFGGDITTYQIQVPIQPGNSGGPLFDFKGNLIGITSSGINRDLDITENVNYAIKSSYLLSLIDVLPETITLPSSTQLASKKLTEQIKVLSDYVVLIKVK